MSDSAENSKKRILLVDDQTIFREMLAELLVIDNNFEICGQAADGHSALAACAELKPDVVLLDIMLPGLHGAEVLSRIRSNYPQIRVLIMTGMDSPQVLRRVIEAGTHGIVHKNSALTCLLEAITRVLQGESYFCPVISKQIREIMSEGRGINPALTTRECEILQLLAEGNTAKEIAAKLDLSVKTVENHRQNLMQKLGIHDVLGLTHYAIKCGLVSVK